MLNDLQKRLSHDALTKQSNEFKTALREVKTAIIPSVQARIDAVNTRMAEQEDYFSKNVKSLQEEVKHGYDTLERIRVKMVRERSDFQLQYSTVTDFMHALRVQSQNLMTQTYSTGKLMQYLLQSEEIKQALDVQEENDRVNLALYGLSGPADERRENSRSPTRHDLPASKSQAYFSGAPKEAQPVQVLKNCSCNTTQQSNDIKRAFKMACLAYNPSRVQVNGTAFSRRELLAQR